MYKCRYGIEGSFKTLFSALALSLRKVNILANGTINLCAATFMHVSCRFLTNRSFQTNV